MRAFFIPNKFKVEDHFDLGKRLHYVLLELIRKLAKLLALRVRRRKNIVSGNTNDYFFVLMTKTTHTSE